MIKLFCSNCGKFFPPTIKDCICGWKRPIHEIRAIDGSPIWENYLKDAAHGQPKVVDSLVLFAWGNRQKNGGVSAFNKEDGTKIWTTEINSTVEGGISVSEGKVYFGSLGSLKFKAEIVCSNIEDGKILWQEQVPKSIRDNPIVNQSRVYIGCDDGVIYVFDKNTGDQVKGWPLKISEGRLFLTFFQNELIVISQHGYIFSLDPVTGKQIWENPIYIEEEIKAPPVHNQNDLVIGTLKGNLYRVDLTTQTIEILIDNLGGIITKPTLMDKSLFVGSKDHFLRGIDIQSGEELWEPYDCYHTIASTPLAVKNVIYVGSNYSNFDKKGGALCAVDALTGNEIWTYKLEANIFSSPVFSDNVIFVGSDDGKVVALPWYFNKFEWAAYKCKNRGEFLEAGSLFALASWGIEYERSSQYVELAVDCWLKDKNPEWAAYIKEQDISATSDEIGLVYKKAGLTIGRRNPALSYELLKTASEWYEDHGSVEIADDCIRLAGRIKEGPNLRIKTIYFPSEWKVNQPKTIIIELINSGSAPALNIKIRLIGEIKSADWIVINESILPGSKLEQKIPISLLDSGQITLEVHYASTNNEIAITKHKYPVQVHQGNSKIEIIYPENYVGNSNFSKSKEHLKALSILFLAADPKDLTRLRIGEEFREIYDMLRSAKLRNQIKLFPPVLSSRPEDISQALLDTHPQIVHFSGHGKSTGALCFENKLGNAHFVSPSALANLFEQFSQTVNCVLLNSCYSVAQAEAISKHVNYVIGMKQEISDVAAIRFAIGFYQALGAGRTIEDSFRLGRVQIELMGVPQYLIPVLFSNSNM